MGLIHLNSKSTNTTSGVNNSMFIDIGLALGKSAGAHVVSTEIRKYIETSTSRKYHSLKHHCITMSNIDILIFSRAFVISYYDPIQIKITFLDKKYLETRFFSTLLPCYVRFLFNIFLI